MWEYVKKINLIDNKNDMKKLVESMYNDDKLDDDYFDDIIYDFVIPKLTLLGCDMSYDFDRNKSNYQKVIESDY